MTADNLIAFSENGIWVAEPDGGNPIRLARRGEYPQWSPDGAHVLYAVHRGEEHEIWSADEAWVVSADGSRRYRLTGNCVAAFWSPDGRRIAYIARKKKQREAKIGQLYIAEADGSRRLYVSETVYQKVRWSSDGRRLSYTKPVADGHRLREEIWIMRADGSEPRRLCPEGSDHRWSPNGDRIFYDSCSFDKDKGNGQISVELRVEEASGANRRILDQRVAELPRLKMLAPGDWSPDGERILYSFLEGEGSPGPDLSEVWVIGADGTGRQKLGEGEFPEWSRDGEMALFWKFSEKNEGEEEPEGALWEAYADGRNPRPRLSEPLAFPGAPPDPWVLARPSPDYKRVIFALPQEECGVDQRMEMWMVEAEGGKKSLLTEHGSRLTFPLCAWSPDSRYVAYATILRDGENRFTAEQGWVAAADGSHRVMLSERSAVVDWRPTPLN